MVKLLEHISTNWLWELSFIFARILAAIMICPLFSSNYLSKLLRTSISLMFTFILFPHFSQIPISNNVLLNMILLISNFLYGSLLGYFISLPIYLVESCGNIIDMQRGEQLGALINQLTGTPSSSIGKLLVKTFTIYFVLNQGFLFFFDIILNSFEFVPINSLFPILSAKLVHSYIYFFCNYLYWVVVLIIPIIIALLLIDLVLSLISSFIPQMNVTVVSMPIKSISALLILSIYIGSILHNVFIKYLAQLKSILF